ncbi:MAG: PspC domain-containing protein [Bacteroidetes bacterium]|nr:PspC domain-containing protein [Bacteroidota bacterium]MDE2672674.1 PspC domain-containing protein [Bacteroidota bacterium]
MRTKTKKGFDLQDLEEQSGYGSLTESDLEELFFEETAPKKGSSINLPIIAGVGLIGVVFLNILQQIGLLPGSGLQEAFIVFPLFGILLVLLFGLMPRKRKRRRKRRGRAAKKKRKRSQQDKETRSKDGDPKISIPLQSQTAKWNLPAKSREKWLAGVCAGLAPYTNVDVTVLRLIFILSAIITGGTIPTIAYIVLAILMSPPDDAEKPGTES